MRLVDLDPHWVGAGGAGIHRRDPATGELVPVLERHGVGLSFDCPCGCKELSYVAFENPLDGGSPHADDKQPLWKRTGDTFETLTLRPSILKTFGCKWHGFITNGDVTPA